MQVYLLPELLAVCKLEDLSGVDLTSPFFCLTRTAEELSLVCPVDRVPEDCLAVETGWRGLMVAGPLDFNLIGILAELSGVLAQADIPIFAVSTFDTDYLLVKETNIDRAKQALQNAGHAVDAG